MPKQLLPLAALCALLLPSCVLRSNIGHNIREAGELYTSVSLRPVDGAIYMPPEQRKQTPPTSRNAEATAYTRLPELTFRRKIFDFPS